MSRALEILLLKDFRDLLKTFVETFPHSYSRFNQGPADFAEDLETYKTFLIENREQLIRAGATGISGYTALYRVSATNSFDEFKMIYFLGRGVERNLLAANHVKIAQVHLFTMIGLLDQRLLKLGIDKPSLRKAMCELIRRSRLDQEMGLTGCYLTYKCVATTPLKEAA